MLTSANITRQYNHHLSKVAAEL